GPDVRRPGSPGAGERAALHRGAAPPSRGRRAGPPGTHADRESRSAGGRRADRRERARTLPGQLVGASTAAARRLARYVGQRPDGSPVRLAGGGGRRREASAVENDLPAGVGASGKAAAEGRAVTSSDIFNDPSLVLTDEVARAMRRAGDAAVLAVPLRAKDRIIGTLSLGDTAGRVCPRAGGVGVQTLRW